MKQKYKSTRDHAIAEHRKMWRWIADETTKRQEPVTKEDYFVAIGLEVIPFCRCFLCDYCGVICENCPLVWDSNISDFKCFEKDRKGDGKGLYEKWFKCTPDEWEQAAELARQIAELPEREEYRDNIPENLQNSSR